MDSESLPFNQWLAQMADREGKTQADLARAADTDTGTVNRWFKGSRRPGSQSCHKIATALRIDPQVVLYMAGHISELPRPLSDYEFVQETRQINDYLAKRLRFVEERELGGGTVRVPLYDRIPADATRWVATQERGTRVSVPEFILRGRSPETTFIVEASGDCLRQHGIVSGDWVFCERLAPGQVPDNGEVVVIRIGDDYLLKEWHRQGDWIELCDGEGCVVKRFSILEEYDVIGVYFNRVGGPNHTG